MTERRAISRRAWMAACGMVLGLCLAFPAGAVQLPSSLLPDGSPWMLPASTPLTGLEQWHLHGLFRQSSGGGWALLSIDQATTQRVEYGAVLPGGIRLAGIENAGVWLQRGQARAFLRLGGALQPGMASEDVADSAHAPAAPSATCQQYLSGGVPFEELAALGMCPLTVSGF